MNARGKTILEILSICETEFNVISGLVMARVMHLLQRHSSASAWLMAEVVLFTLFLYFFQLLAQSTTFLLDPMDE
jgi:glucose dehydrogenase